MPCVWVQWDGRTNGLEVAGGDTEAPAVPSAPAAPAAVAAEVLVIVMKTAKGKIKGLRVKNKKKKSSFLKRYVSI